MTAQTFPEFAQRWRPEVDRALDRLLPAATETPVRLHEAMRYCVLGGGKRVRPLLVLMAGETFGAQSAASLAGGAALEMVHCFSLVHDDLPALDDDDLRRGRETVHRRYDEATAVLVGDALLNLGLQVFLEEPPELSPEVRSRSAALAMEAIGTRGMIGGQMSDLEAERRWPDDPMAALESIHARKTGALLRAALRIGGAYGAAGAEEDETLGTLGDRIGLLFQIRDDILDVEGASEVLGKTAGKDSRARKLTYPSLVGLDRSRQILTEVRDEALEAIARLPRHRDVFRSLVSYLCDRDR